VLFGPFEAKGSSRTIIKKAVVDVESTSIAMMVCNLQFDSLSLLLFLSNFCHTPSTGKGEQGQ
jgi:hypothetical protein